MTSNTASRKAISVSSDVAARIIKKSKRPLLVVGASISKNVELIDKLVRISNTGAPIAATSTSSKYFADKKKEVFSIGLVDIVNLLKDAEWKGLDGRGNYDLVIFIGIEYWLLSQMASTLKNFSEIATLNLSRYYQPNAAFSFPNITEDLCAEYLDEICEKLEK